ncbi:hypothetical protein, partial [Klebsiella pneumoniae]
ATDARSFPLFLALSGWTPATPEIHPAPVRLTPDHPQKSTVLDAPDEAAKLLLILRVVSRSLWRTLTGAGTPEKTALGCRLFLSHAGACSLFLRGCAFSAWGGKRLASAVKAERNHHGRDRRRHALGHVRGLCSGGCASRR